jgi:adenylate cyclase
MSDLFNWLAANESGISAIAAMMAIIAGVVVVLSPLGAGVRGFFSSGRKIGNDQSQPVLDLPSTDVQTKGITPPPLITDKPSIAVLPFVNMSDDKSQEYFADGMTEDIITGLSFDSRLSVTARNSTFAYKGQSPDIRTVGKELGVRYVLEGSIRPINDRLRITVQLIETDSGNHIWADKIDRPTAEIFDIMDAVVDDLVTALCSNLGVAESNRAKRQRPENLEAWALCVQAEVAVLLQMDSKAIVEARKLAQQASEIGPDYAISWALLSFLIGMDIVYGHSTDLDEDSEQAFSLISKALRLAPNDPIVLCYCGFAAIFAGKANQGVAYLERSLAINPNSSFSQFVYGAALLFDGRLDDSIAHLELFIARAPKDPYINLAYYYLACAYSLLQDFRNSEQAARNCVKHSPGYPWGHLVLGLALEGQDRV